MMIFIGVLSSLIGIAVLLCLVYLFVLVRPARRVSPDEALLCDYAHRGLHGGGVPENSLAAFELACKKGFGIELDVQLSRDGKVMVFHDYTLLRMTGCDKKLCELTAEELCALSLGGTEEKIPTFEQVLSLVDGRVPLLVELKGESTDTSLCASVAELLKEYKGKYCLESFNPLLIGNMKKFLPEAFRGLLYTNVCREKKNHSALSILLTAMALNVVAAPDFIAYNKEDRNSFPVRLATRFFRTTQFVWTIKSSKELSDAHVLGEYPIFENIDIG
jgi:glycerophosphoryl diester phosphodiesterase